jgi:hypothetical protein
LLTTLWRREHAAVQDETLIADPRGAMDAVSLRNFWLSMGEPQTTPYGFVMPANLAISVYN